MTKHKYTNEQIELILSLKASGLSWQDITLKFNTHFGIRKSKEALRKVFRDVNMNKIENKPKVLVFDIETAPVVAHVWGLWENNVGLNQIVSDWHILSWSAKWLGSKEVLYQDNRGNKDLQDDSKLLEGIWKLLDEADITITHNGVKFDTKKLNARFILNGMQPPSTYKSIDTLKIARKNFAFTSNRLEYITEKLCVKYKKRKSKAFVGHKLWTECLKGNKAAWKEMEAYNRMDVLSLEEVYKKLIPWDSGLNFNVYSAGETNVCECGSIDIKTNGHYFTKVGKFQRFRCNSCGHETRGRTNLLSATKRKSLNAGTR